jgi:hypothetical protein
VALLLLFFLTKGLSIGRVIRRLIVRREASISDVL